MNKIILTLGLVLTTLVVMAQTNQSYVNPKFYSLAKNHKTVAVIPFEVQIGLRPKERETITAEQLKEMELKEGVAVQNGLVNWFLRKANRKDLRIEFQDVAATNALLSKQGIDVSNIKNYTPHELASILGVDAIMGGLMKTSKPMSEGASVALGMAIGFWGNTSSGDVTITLNNATDGAVLWKYSTDLSGGLGTDVDTLIDGLMRNASRKFPYFFMAKYEKQAKK
jgi:hypothetical protein